MAPRVYNKPVKRKNFITSAAFEGPDNDLELKVNYLDQFGTPRQFSFPCEGDNPGLICLPTSIDITDVDRLPRDLLVAHIRMAAMIANATPGSQEFDDAMVYQNGGRDFQMAISTKVQVTNVALYDEDEYVTVTLREGTSGPTRDVNIAHNEFNYQFVPETQLYVIAGAIRSEYTYVHDYYENDTLTSSQKSDIVSFVTGNDFWI